MRFSPNLSQWTFKHSLSCLESYCPIYDYFQHVYFTIVQILRAWRLLKLSIVWTLVEACHLQVPKSRKLQVWALNLGLGVKVRALSNSAIEIMLGISKARRCLVWTTLCPLPTWLWLSLKVAFKNTAFTPSTLCSAKSSFQMMWHGLKKKVLSLKHWTSHRYLDMRHEHKTFKSVASCPCDSLLLVLAMRARGAPLTKTDGKISE